MMLCMCTAGPVLQESGLVSGRTLVGFVDVLGMDV